MSHTVDPTSSNRIAGELLPANVLLAAWATWTAVAAGMWAYVLLTAGQRIASDQSYLLWWPAAASVTVGTTATAVSATRLHRQTRRRHSPHPAPPAGPAPGEPADLHHDVRRRRRSERGDANLFWVLGLTVMILFLGGISTDLWHVISQARTLDAAADSAAAAGATGLDPTSYRQSGQAVLDPNAATQSALDNLSHQTGLPGPPNPQITVNPDNITVVLHGHVNLTLLQIFASGGIDLTSTGNAAARAGP